MSVIIKRLYNAQGQETGAILSAIFGTAITLQQKMTAEGQLINYAFNTLYPGQGLNIYREMYHDTASIVVIKNINGLPSQTVTI